MSHKYFITKGIVFTKVLVANFKREGLLWFFKGIIKNLVYELLWLVFLPVTVILHLLNYRLVKIRSEHIGHLAIEVSTLIKELKLGHLPTKNRFLILDEKKKVNKHLFKYWRLYFPVLKNQFLVQILKIMTRHYFMCEDVSRYISAYFGAQDAYRINAEWGDRPPVIHLTEEDDKWGESKLKELGVPGGRWYVCLHAREGGYIPKNELIQSHRNVKIESTYLAVSEIVRHGGYVIRMGDPTMQAFPNMPNVIDYANHYLKSDRMDVYLCARAKFFLGCTSGLAFLSSIFNVPIAHMNMIPMETMGFNAQDISIPKLLLSKSEKRYLNFEEILNTDIGGFYFTNQYVKNNIEVIDNTSEEILYLVIEMFQRLHFMFSEDDNEELHQKYVSLFRKGYYSEGSNARICLEFLKRHKDLIPKNDSQ